MVPSPQEEGEAHKINIFSLTGGEGDPVLYLPGMGWTAESAGVLSPILEERYCLHRLDLPGMGRSEPLTRIPGWKDLALWVHGYCRDHGWDQVRIIGHSIGGLIALAFADQFPEQLYQLVLLDAGYQSIPRFPEDVAKPLRYFLPLANMLASLGWVEWVTRRIVASGKPGNTPLHSPDNELIEAEFQEFVESQRLLITNELREAFYIAHKVIQVNEDTIKLLLGIYRTKPVTAFNRLKSPTLLVIPENMTHHPPLTQIDERGLPVLLYEVSGGHYVHYSHPEIGYVIRDFFDHWS
ncbi:MAG: alpha/beta hydrolase [Firmicutes bacterium]|nr:alpha/beta hydrolase [Bacillota bacterium]MCL5013993.1 alpha/beta hydrolase [Bacillota bacterium]